jgi:protein-disulfide isomerase
LTRLTSQMAYVLRGGLVAIVFAIPGWPENGHMGNNTITSRQAEAMLAELTQIRQLLERRVQDVVSAPTPSRPHPARRAQLRIDDVNFLGSKDAPLTMIEYSDVQCPFCRTFHDTAFAAIKKNYIDTGKLRFFVRDLPLNFHDYAIPAAIASRCAGVQRRFWDMRETLISNAPKLSEQNILSYAKDLHLNMAEFSSCLNSGKFRMAIDRDVGEAAGLNLNGTPSFVIGRTTPEGVDGVTVVGAMPYEAFEAKFKSLETER